MNLLLPRQKVAMDGVHTCNSDLQSMNLLLPRQKVAMYGVHTCNSDLNLQGVVALCFHDHLITWTLC